ncbi:MAG: hypothetical protein KFF72_14610 [Arthrospira sp. SH-MAG29]|nr:hypothetical protein [Arthrospira sp. SH-MAG29]MBS0017557.1 hypothetical protein [Arthrospira sp. SH-MAG29]
MSRNYKVAEKRNRVSSRGIRGLASPLTAHHPGWLYMASSEVFTRVI